MSMSELTEEQIAQIRAQSSGWPDVAKLLAEVDRLKAELAHERASKATVCQLDTIVIDEWRAEVERVKAESDARRKADAQYLAEVIRDRDSNHEAADELAAIIATLTGTDIGEHSNMNDPWHNAIEAGESLIAAELREIIRVFASTAPEFEAQEALRARVAELEEERDAAQGVATEHFERFMAASARAERMTPVVEAAKGLVERMKSAVGWSHSSAQQWLDPESYALFAAVDAYNAGGADDTNTSEEAGRERECPGKPTTPGAVDDGLHCAHWHDGEACCRCQASAEVVPDGSR